MFHRKPTIWRGDAKAPSHPAQFPNKACLGNAVTHVFDYRAAEHDVESPGIERQCLARLHALVSQPSIVGYAYVQDRDLRPGLKIIHKRLEHLLPDAPGNPQ